MTQKQLSMDRSDVLVVGTGYLGARVAELARQSGATVYTTTRKTERFPALERSDFRPVRFDWTRPVDRGNRLPSGLSARCRVLVAVSYDRSSGIDRYQSQVGGLENLLAHLPSDARICYISTTGVYHQTDGRWVDETSPTHPDRLGGRVHLQAEQVLHLKRPFSPWQILRLAGIYGPGRVPRAADVIAGRPIEAPEAGFLNLIHVHDAARAVIASWHAMIGGEAVAGVQSRLYAVADDRPVPRREFYREIARQCHVERPRFVPPPDHAPVTMRSNSNKRVWNRKLKRDLLPSLTFPNYRCGLADVLRPSLE